MKSLLNGIVFAAVVAAPLAAFAQSGTPPARVEQAGYSSDDWAHYPKNIQDAQARAAAQSGNATYGASSGGSSQAGQRGEITVSPYSPPIEVVGH